MAAWGRCCAAFQSRKDPSSRLAWEEGKEEGMEREKKGKNDRRKGWGWERRGREKESELER